MADAREICLGDASRTDFEKNYFKFKFLLNDGIPICIRNHLPYFEKLSALFETKPQKMAVNFFYLRHFMEFGPEINNLWLTVFSQNATYKGSALIMDKEHRTKYCANLVWDTKVYQPAIMRRLAEKYDPQQVKDTAS